MAKTKTILMSGTASGCSYAGVLKDLPHVNLILALTGEDKIAGRGRRDKKPELARFCSETGVDVIQTDNINSPKSINKLKNAAANTALVVDFGQILSKEVLNVFPSGCFNIHYSLLPDLRGAAPVRWALLKGYKKTGVTAMKMNRDIDAGQIIFKKPVKISPEDNYRLLKGKLTEEGIKLAEKIFKYLSEGRKLPLKNQDVSKVTRAPKIGKVICRLNWRSTSSEIVNKIRALAPEPGCWCIFKKKNIRIKVLKARDIKNYKASARPGQVVSSGKKTFKVKASSGVVEILEVHPAGKRIMTTSSFLAGNPVVPGDMFQ